MVDSARLIVRDKDVLRTPEARTRRAAKVRARATYQSHAHFATCSILGCGRPSTGLSISLCRQHLLHRQRHGSPFCKTPTGPTLAPYLKLALAYLAVHQRDPFIRGAISGLSELTACAGDVIPATRLRGLAPFVRSRIALARLREANVKPERLLAIVIAVHALIKHDPARTHRIKDWRIVAIAKAAHRLASGDHRVWELRDDGGRVVQRSEMHTYPRSTGRVLRYLGEAIEAECELVLDKHLEKIVAMIS